MGLLVSYGTRNRSIDTWANLDWMRMLYMAFSPVFYNIISYLLLAITPIKNLPFIFIFFVYPLFSAMILSLATNIGNTLTFKVGYLTSEVIFTFISKFLLIIFLKLLFDINLKKVKESW